MGAAVTALESALMRTARTKEATNCAQHTAPTDAEAALRMESGAGLPT
jgi:hypothetical protein